MATYEITLRRTVDEYLTVVVKADSDDRAIAEAVALATVADHGGVGGLDWERSVREPPQTETLVKDYKGDK